MNSLSWPKKASVAALLLLLASCQTVRTRKDIQRERSAPKVSHQESRPIQQNPVMPSTAPSITPTPQETAVSEVEPAEDSAPAAPLPLPPILPPLPKIGFILGPGGAKTYAHIGFLQELSRLRLPVVAMGGIEFGAPIAALYANKEQANDVEWQMFKIKEEDIRKKNILGAVTGNIDLGAMKSFLSGAFYRLRLEDFRIQFSCPSLNLKKSQVFLMNRGGAEQALSVCLAYPPFFKPYQESISAVREVAALANYLRSRGVNHIALVNVLEAPNGVRPFVSDIYETNNLIWNEIAAIYNGPIAGVDTVIHLETAGYSIVDFDKRREIMNKGSESSARQLRQFMLKLGL